MEWSSSYLLPAVNQLTPAAIKLLLRVKNMVLQEPLRLDMGVWASHAPKHKYPLAASVNEEDVSKKYPACGTVGCIGGWAEMLNRVDHPYSKKDAGVILGLTWAQEEELFYGAVGHKPQTMAHAKAVAKRIDTFIEKYREVPPR